MLSESAGLLVAAELTGADEGELAVSVSAMDGMSTRSCSVAGEPNLFMGLSAAADTAGRVWVCWGKTLVEVDARAATAEPIPLPDDGLVASWELVGAGQAVALAVDHLDRGHVLRLLDENLWVYDPGQRDWSTSALLPELIPTGPHAGLALLGEHAIVTGPVTGPGGLQPGPAGQPVLSRRSPHGTNMLPLRTAARSVRTGSTCIDTTLTASSSRHSGCRARFGRHPHRPRPATA